MNELSADLGASEKAAVESAAGAEAIVDRVFRAILERRLPPAAKLSERVLCCCSPSEPIDGPARPPCSRRTGNSCAFEIPGAFVAVPSSEEARAVFEARRTIEPTIASKAALEVTAEQVSHLRRHLVAEAGARDRGARHDAIRLSGQFHVELAKYARNPVLARFVEELVARTSLIIGLFGATEATFCMCDEHEALLAAIERHDGARAQEIMLSHLAHIENEAPSSAIGPWATSTFARFFECSGICSALSLSSDRRLLAQIPNCASMRHSLPPHEPRASIRHLRENRRPVADFGLPKQPQKIIVEYLAPPDHGHELYEIYRRAFVFAVRFGPARHVGQSGVDGHDARRPQPSSRSPRHSSSS